ncbi:MAG TPA: bifunctional precorrin-2 dehydrogenase/sirohydrochlorin ferrochelatase [Gemmatimonadaceae bacterium]
MSDFPIALHGERITAVIIGGGRVAARKALALLESGAQVTVVAPEFASEIADADGYPGLRLVKDSYRADQIAAATLVVAATDSRDVNAQIAVDAHRSGKLVNIADFPDEGNFHTMALHRSGDVTIAVSAGGVPGAASRIRDAIAQRFDGRYERAVTALRGIRSRMLATDSDTWRTAAPSLIGEDFCDSVENGSFETRIEDWR